MKTKSNPLVSNWNRRRKNNTTSANTAPIPTPNTICAKTWYRTEPAETEVSIIATTMVTIKYAIGSLLPLSTSSRDAVPYFKFSFFARKMEKTEAASVELMTEPISKLSSNPTCSTMWQKPPTATAVRKTPTVESRMARPATGFAALHFVPKPP